ncbi:ninjurin-1-like [Ceratina calcarata]|uniref:Ninjurin-1-like n=1 Tax=Ceratina calcarata TaxID=156304 RepID=A0AAJ7NAP9_9HYME|nr:ninjurin-1-like [Ceratina calcarata]XP_026672347.1 ninjurin-1-like [Ceratina calcarata]
MDDKEKGNKIDMVEEVVVKDTFSFTENMSGNKQGSVEDMDEKDGFDDTSNENIKMNKSDMVESVVVNDTVPAVDTTDKKSLPYKDTNSFAAKKTVAQGMMDVALITANANQLRYLIEYQRESVTFFWILGLIIISLLLQIAVGVSLVFKGRFDIKGKSKSLTARKIDNYVVIGVFLITIINVFIAAFSISVTTQPLSVLAGGQQ